MTLKSRREIELSQLIRLQNLRVINAEMEYRKSQNEYVKVHDAAQERTDRVDRLRTQLGLLICHSCDQQVSQKIQYSEFYNERKTWLDLDLERDEYWLEDDLRELNEAEEKRTEKRKLWLQLRSRESRSQVKLKLAKTDRIRQGELKIESEVDEFLTTLVCKPR